MPCPRCAGTGQCPDCHGKGSQECPACSGRGTRETSRGISYQCKSCGGAGSIACPPACSSCEGTGEITAELQKKARDRYAVRFANLTPSSQLTRWLMALNVLTFTAGAASPRLYYAMLLKPDALSSHRYWEFLTCEFQHAAYPFGLLHLGLNMLALMAVGPVLEGMYGKARFLLIYLGSGLAASAVSFWGHVVLNGEWPGVGASGALFGLIGALIAVYWRWRMFSWEAIQRYSFWPIVLLAGGFAGEFYDFSLIDNWGHLGGLLGGFIIAVALPRPRGH